MPRFLITVAALAALAAVAAPSLAAENIPGATVRADSGKGATDRKARLDARKAKGS